MDGGTNQMKMKINSQALALGTYIALQPLNVFAQSMPWESPLRQLLDSLQGTTARTIIIGAIIIAGLALCVGEAGSFFRRAMAAVFGGAVAVGASSWAPSLFEW